MELVLNFTIAVSLRGADETRADIMLHTKLTNLIAKYAGKARVGTFFLLYSAQQFFSFVSASKASLIENTIKTGLHVDQVIEDFKNDDSSATPIGFGLTASSFGILSALMGANPEAAAAAAVFSGVASILQATTAPPPDTEVDYGARLTNTVYDAFNNTMATLDMLTSTIAGEKGTNQADLPLEMQTQSFKNPIMNVFGDGKWLISDPGTGVDAIYEIFFKHLVSSPDEVEEGQSSRLVCIRADILSA
jgi:hypothetical protein